MPRLTTTALMTILFATVGAVAAVTQTSAPPRSPSPDSVASIQVGEWNADDKPGLRVATGKWIDVLYGRPIKRGRAEVFGSGATYGAAVKSGAAVWRAGANVLTRLRTEAPLVFAGKTVPAGDVHVVRRPEKLFELDDDPVVAERAGRR